MEAVITQGVAMCNPETLTDEQLRDEVRRLQQDALQTSMALHRMNCVAYNQAEALKQLVDAHERADANAIHQKLQELSEWRQQHQQRPAAH